MTLDEMMKNWSNHTTLSIPNKPPSRLRELLKKLKTEEIEYFDVPGFEGIYQLSKDGSLKKLNKHQDRITDVKKVKGKKISLSKNRVQILVTYDMLMKLVFGEQKED